MGIVSLQGIGYHLRPIFRRWYPCTRSKLSPVYPVCTRGLPNPPLHPVAVGAFDVRPRARSKTMLP